MVKHCPSTLSSRDKGVCVGLNKWKIKEGGHYTNEAKTILYRYEHEIPTCVLTTG